MKLRIPLCLMLLFSATAFSQETIRIPDVAFEEALIDLEIDTNGLNGTILASDARYVVNLNIEDPANNKRLPKVHQKIKDLTGIEHFTNLKRLICFGNEIKKLDLSKNKNLTFVNCSQNKITELDVSNSPNLFFLSCDSNKLTSLKLGNKPELTELYANSNRLTKLDLKEATALNVIDVSANNISEVLVNETALNSIPEGWYKDEGTIYVTAFGNKSTGTPIVTAKTEITKNLQSSKETTVVTELPKTKTYDESFKRLVVSEYEKIVLQEAYLQAKKEEIQRKYNMDMEELSKWIKKFGKLPTQKNDSFISGNDSLAKNK